MTRRAATEDAAQQRQRQTDLLAVGDDHLVLPTPPEAVPAKKDSRTTEAVDHAPETSGRGQRRIDVDEIGVERITHDDVVGPRAQPCGHLLVEIGGNRPRHGEQNGPAHVHDAASLDRH